LKKQYGKFVSPPSGSGREESGLRVLHQTNMSNHIPTGKQMVLKDKRVKKVGRSWGDLSQQMLAHARR